MGGRGGPRKSEVGHKMAAAVIRRRPVADGWRARGGEGGEGHPSVSPPQERSRDAWKLFPSPSPARGDGRVKCP